MSNQVLLIPNSHFIISTLLQESSVVIFLNKWIPCDALYVALSSHFNLQELKFDSKQLNKALRSSKIITIKMYMHTQLSVTSDQVGIICQKYHPKIDSQKKEEVLYPLTISYLQKEILHHSLMVSGSIIYIYMRYK